MINNCTLGTFSSNCRFNTMSQMLKAAANIAPRGVYVCGNSTSTTSGLTVTLVKEGSAGEYALEAGALVLGDQGDRIVFRNNMVLFADWELCDLKFTISSFPSCDACR